MKTKLLILLAVLSLIAFGSWIEAKPPMFAVDLSSPGPIGDETPGTGAFTDFSSTGSFDADRYETIWIPASQMVSTATNGATYGVYEYTTTNDINIEYFAYDSGTTEYIEFDYTMPAGWDTTSLKMKFEWMGASGCTVFDTVTIGVAAVTRNDGEANDAAVGTYVDIQDTVLADADDEVHRTATTGTITPAGTPTAGGTIHFKIRRTTTDAAMAEDLWLTRAGIQYKITSAETAW